MRINVQKDWLRDHTSWAPCGIEMKIKGILKYWFWISLHQGTLPILWSRIQGYMLSLMNEVDPWLLLLLCVLYEIQNQIFHYTHCFCVFLIFQNLFIYFYVKQNKTKLKTNKQKHERKHTKHKTRCKYMREEEKEERSLHEDYTNVLV